jgi:hypothetical protein
VVKAKRGERGRETPDKKYIYKERRRKKGKRKTMWNAAGTLFLQGKVNLARFVVLLFHVIWSRFVFAGFLPTNE